MKENKQLINKFTKKGNKIKRKKGGDGQTKIEKKDGVKENKRKRQTKMKERRTESEINKNRKERRKKRK